jgi:response regulator of citrate/malate metabolism
MEDSYKLVLLIDDDDIDNIIHNMVIDAIGFAEKTIIYKTVEDAIKYLKKARNGEAEIPEIILLDLIMPLESGFVFLDEFETFPESFKLNTKIVVITHSIDEREQEKTKMNKNVSYFIDKPLTVEKLELLAVTI